MKKHYIPLHKITHRVSKFISPKCRNKIKLNKRAPKTRFPLLADTMPLLSYNFVTALKENIINFRIEVCFLILSRLVILFIVKSICFYDLLH